MSSVEEGERTLLAEALEALGVRRLVLGIHQAAFPAGELDAGTGAPGSAAGRAFAEFVARLGFNTLQLGPDGQVSLVNPSPYDGTAFARSLTSCSMDAFAGGSAGVLLRPEELAALCAPRADESAEPGRTDLARALRVSAETLSQAHARFRACADDPGFAETRQDFERFRREQSAWLEQDALFEAFARRLGHDDPTRFDPAVAALLADDPGAASRRSAMRATLGAELERAELGQWLAERDAQAFRDHAHAAGLELFGDLQVGWSHRDRFLRASAFNRRFLLGAPPSRTNPEGQPWGYPLLDPDQLDDPSSAARRLVSLRLGRALSAYDGLRVDHPHGLVCPWVYEAAAEDPLRAVQAGVRAFESPDLDDPTLRRWAIARVEDLDPGQARHADGWVRRAQPAQVARWSRLMDEVVQRAAEAHGGAPALSVEVLSTCPAPLHWVLERHGLGRFRVVQKANVEREGDVYRTDQARRADWVMLGNHDTSSIWDRCAQWIDDDQAAVRARYLAARLVPDGRDRERAAAQMTRSPAALAQAHLADLFFCDAENVLVYFVDLFGEHEPYNRPGVVDPRNWSLRVPGDFTGVYARRRALGQALDLRGALATALRARGVRLDLANALETPVAL